jgi:hypothetical protein
VLLIGRPEEAGRAAAGGWPSRGWRLADRPDRIFMQKIVILLKSGLNISSADFLTTFGSLQVY